MKKSTKIWLVLASFLTIIGFTMFAFAMTKYNWDFKKLSTEEYETNIHEIAEDFDNISFNTDTPNITFALSDDEKCKIECFESEKSKHLIAVKENTLTIETQNKNNWYDYIGINFHSPKITVFLPKLAYSTLSISQDTGDIIIPKDFSFSATQIRSSTGDVDFLASVEEALEIKTSTGDINVKYTTSKSLTLIASTGDITVSNVNCHKDINIKLSTGESNLTDIKCQNLKAQASTGNISLNNVLTNEKFSVKTSTGDVNFDHFDAKEIYIKTDTGNVKGNLLTDKVFITNTDTGNVDVPKTVSGGKCEVVTDTGNIKITINEK